MPEGFSSLSWTDLWFNVGLTFMALVGLVTGAVGYLRPRSPAPPSVSAVMIEKEEIIRLTAAFEALGRVLASQQRVIEENTEQLEINSRVIKAVGEFSEQAAKDLRGLTIELENTRRSK